MKSFEYTITDGVGIHARPAGLLVKEAQKYESVIKIACKGREAEARKLMAVMGLGVKCGDKVTVTAQGADEDEAAAAIEEFFKKNL